MARTRAGLGEQPRLSDYLSAGLLARSCPRDRVERVLAAHGKASERERDLPAYAVVYYVMALALYSGVAYGEVLRCLVEGLDFLRDRAQRLRVPGNSAISQARSRLSWEVMADLAAQGVGPIALSSTRGAWYRGWRVVSLDGTTLEVADEQANARAFGYPGASRGQARCPQLRCVGLLENGTRVFYAAHIGPYGRSEIKLAHEVVAHLDGQTLCLADRAFFGYPLWAAAQATGSHLLWRLKRSNLRRCEQALSDGSYLTTVYPDRKAQRAQAHGLRVRIIEYRLRDMDAAQPAYRLVTTLLDPDQASARELAPLYHQRWEIETAFDELKTHLKGGEIRLRSKTPALVRQEFYGFVLTYFAIRQLIHEAALDRDQDPDRLSFINAVRVLRRKTPLAGAIPPLSSARAGGRPCSWKWPMRRSSPAVACHVRVPYDVKCPGGR